MAEGDVPAEPEAVRVRPRQAMVVVIASATGAVTGASGSKETHPAVPHMLMWPLSAWWDGGQPCAADRLAGGGLKRLNVQVVHITTRTSRKLAAVAQAIARDQSAVVGRLPATVKNSAPIAATPAALANCWVVVRMPEAVPASCGGR